MKQKNIPANYFYPDCFEEFIGRAVRALPGAQARICISTNHKGVHILIKFDTGLLPENFYLKFSDKENVWIYFLYEESKPLWKIRADTIAVNL